MKNEDWVRSLAEKPHDADLRRVYADWLEDQNAPAEQIAEQRLTAEQLSALFALPGIRVEEDRKRPEGMFMVEDGQTGVRYGLNPTTGYVRRYTRIQRMAYDHKTRQRVARFEWRSEALNPPHKAGETRQAGDPMTMRKIYSLAEQVAIVLRAIERARKKLSKQGEAPTEV
jgi:uncharacterized protein (TIGR02996 family)